MFVVACMIPTLILAAEERPAIDIVFCIDCSGSMGAVIETAKRKVWTIVNQVAQAQPAPVLRIGLIGYGDADRSHRVFPLTDDLDQVYKDLMTFKDEGWGDEFVGLAVHKATSEMKWSTGKQVLRLIYMVGNETAAQGPDQFDYKLTTPRAIAAGIQINAIYCGSADYDNATPTWRELAKLADGQYLEIAQDGGTVAVATPFDEEIAKLNEALNKTYLAYGEQRREREAMQMEQDANASKVGGGEVLADRALAKSSRQYRNAGWDLVDASKEADFKLAEIADDELPEPMRALKPEERQAYIDARATERQAVQQKIRDLADKREAFIKEELAEQGGTADGFDVAVIESLRKQASEKGFEFAK